MYSGNGVAMSVPGEVYTMTGSSKTGLITLRLPVEILDVADRRAERAGISRGEYIRRVVVVQLSRVSHHK